jgi:DNA-3-methyladenine glycosylase
VTAPDPRLPRAFYERPTLTVARELLGQRLVRVLAGIRLSGLICETEAYGGPDDESSHAFRRTRRSAIMYGAPGHAYVYRIYGIHHCLNAVTEPADQPGAVLIRAIFPQEGLDIMRGHRDVRTDAHLTDGPGKLCEALAIDLAQNGLDLVNGETISIEADARAADAEVRMAPRIGVRGSTEARERPWRFVWTPVTAPAARAS